VEISMTKKFIISPELRVLVAYLMPQFDTMGDKFLIKIAGDIIDRTWAEGTELTDDAWYTLRLGVLRALNAPMGTDGQEIFLPRYDGHGDFEEWIGNIHPLEVDKVDTSEENSFLVSDVIGRLRYEV
jgi:hypothetical protein